MEAKLYYIHDPMCSWCWGYRPQWNKLQAQLPSFIEVEYLVGGLAPDSDVAMEQAQQQMIQAHWRTIRQKLGTEFNFDFWHENTPRRSTYNACRAVIAAAKQDCEKTMIEAIQRAYYLNAQNPSDKGVVIALAQQLEQRDCTFDANQFVNDLNSEPLEAELMRQIELSRSLTQQGFPSLVLSYLGCNYQIGIDYLNCATTITQLKKIIGW